MYEMEHYCFKEDLPYDFFTPIHQNTNSNGEFLAYVKESSPHQKSIELKFHSIPDIYELVEFLNRNHKD